MNLIPNFPSPPPLPEAPWLAWLLFEASGWPAALLALLGLCTFLVLNGRGDPRALRVLGLWLLAAAALWGLGRAVVTARERLGAATRAIIADVARADGDSLHTRLGPGAQLVGRLAGLPLDRADLIERVKSTTGRQYPIESWAVLEVQAYQPAPGKAQSMALVRVQLREGGINFSWWLIDWSDASGQWRADRIEPLAIQGVLPLQGAR